MEVYAGFLEHTDHHVGRLVDAIEELGALENTLVYYIIGDNGASAEGTVNGAFNEMANFNGLAAIETPEFMAAMKDKLGTVDAYNHYSVGWAWAMCAPYQWTKQVASHWGGTRNGTIVHWPAGFESRGEVRSQFSHVIDVAPTVLEAAGLPEPTFVNGVQQSPIEGTSMLYSFDDGDAAERHDLQYFEMAGNRGIYFKGWSAVTRHSTPWLPHEQLPALDDDVWELYDGNSDWTQAHDLAASDPERLARLQRLWLIEAVRYNVLPIDDRRFERLNATIAGRPQLITGTTQVLFPGMKRLSENSVIDVKNRSFSVTAASDDRVARGHERCPHRPGRSGHQPARRTLKAGVGELVPARDQDVADDALAPEDVVAELAEDDAQCEAGRREERGPVQCVADGRDDLPLASGLGGRKVDGPGDVGVVEQVQQGTDLVDHRDPRPELLPGPEWTGQTEASELEEALHRAALAGQHDSGACQRDGRTGIHGGLSTCLPREDDVREEPLARRARLGQGLVAAVAVVADRRPRDQAHGVVRGRHGGRDGMGAVGARGEDLALVGRGPPLVTQAGAGEVHDAVDPFQGSGVEGAAVRGPLHLVPPAGRVAHETHHLVAALTQRGDEGGADQAGGSGDGDAAHVVLRSVVLRFGCSGYGAPTSPHHRPRSASKAPSSRRDFIVVRKRAASAPSTMRWS